MTGCQLWDAVAPAAKKIIYRFYGRNEHDAEDAMQDAALRCIELPTEYPTLNQAELIMIARQSIWNRAVDATRRKKVQTRITFDLSRRCREADKGFVPTIATYELVERVRSELADRDKVIFDLKAKGYHGYDEMAAEAGVSLRAVQHSVVRIHKAAEKYL